MSIAQIEAQEMIIKSLRLENEDLKKELSKVKRFYMTKIERLENEKTKKKKG